MPKKKELDYTKIKTAKKKQINANIGILAKEAKVKPSDFKNRKAYLNYISKKAGYQNYNQWQKARRQASIPAGRGGRKKKIIKFYYSYTLAKLKNYQIEKSKMEKYFLSVNRPKDLKFFKITSENIERPFIENSQENKNIEILLDWLSNKLEQIYEMHVTPPIFKEERDNAKVIITLQYDMPTNSTGIPEENLEELDDVF